MELAKVAPGNRVLDLATGIGEPAATAARKVGPSGRVVATDQSVEMLAFARERSAALGLHNLEFIEADAESPPTESLSIGEGGFDAVLCRWGLMFLPDFEAALRRVHQSLKSGGWFATAVWGSAVEVPMLSIGNDEVRALAALPAPAPDSLGPLRFADPAIVEQALGKIGFRQLRTERVPVNFEFASSEQFVEFREQVSATFRAMLASKPADLQDRIRAAIRNAAARYAGPGGVVRMSNLSICVAAQK